jgi:hypothetical protein
MRGGGKRRERGGEGEYTIDTSLYWMKREVLHAYLIASVCDKW